MFLVSQVCFFKEAKLQLLQPPERPFTSLVCQWVDFWGRRCGVSGLVCWLRSALRSGRLEFFCCVMLTKLCQNWAKTGVRRKEEVGTCGHVKDFMSKTRTVQRLQCLLMKCQNYFQHGICPHVYPQSLARPAPIHHHHHISSYCHARLNLN